MIRKILNKIKQIICSKKYFFMILFILLIYYVMYMRTNGQMYDYYCFNFYVLSYEYGFISRGFIGSIVTFFFPFITIKKLYFILHLVSFFFMILVSYILDIIINKYKDKTIGFVASLLCIFTPASFMLMITMSEFGRLDIFIFIFTIISLILIYKKRLLFLIPVLIIISMFTHQNFLFMYAPLILMIILYNYFKDKNIKWLKLFVISVFALLLSFSLIIKYGKPDGFNDAKEFTAVLQTKTDIPIYSYEFSPIDAEYFKSIEDNMKLTSERLLEFDKRHISIGVILLCIYLYAQNLLCYDLLFKKYKILPILLLSCLGAIPLYFIGVDYGRWYTAIINSFVLLFVYLTFDNMKLINKNINQLKSKAGLLIMMVIFYILIMPTTPLTFMKFEKIKEILSKIKEIIEHLIR